MKGLAGPAAQELLDLDRRLDGLAAGRTAGGDGLVAVAARLAALPEAVWDEVAPPASSVRRHRGPARQVARRPVVLAVAAAVVAAAVTVAGLALSGGEAPTPTPPSSWELAGYVDQPAWVATGAPGADGRPVQVTCPAPSTCYADQPAGPPAGAVIEVTGDRGSTWSALGLPAGTVATTGLSCPSPATCSVGATGPAGGEVLTLATGGQRWTSGALPDPAALLTGLACPATGDCVAVGHDPATATGAAGLPVAFRSNDAGAHWSSVPLPGPFLLGGPGGLSCTAQGCVAVGLVLGTGTVETGAVRYTTDGGATWSVGNVPSGVGRISAVSCPDATHCVAIGARSSTGPAGSAPPFEVLATSDGGHTWSVTGSFESGSLTVNAVSCPTVSECWAAGATARSTALLAVTQDGGATWAPVTFQAAAGLGPSSPDVEWVTSVSCVEAGSCLALGLGGTGTTSVPRTVALRSAG